MGTEDRIPGNVQRGIPSIPTYGWIIIGLLIFAVVITLIIAVYTRYKYEKETHALHTLIKTPVTETEMNLLLKYRKLNKNDKTVIDDAVKSLSKNHKDNIDTNE